MKVGLISLEGCVRTSLTIISCGKRSFSIGFSLTLNPCANRCSLVFPLFDTLQWERVGLLCRGAQCLGEDEGCEEPNRKLLTNSPVCLLFCYQRNFKVLKWCLLCVHGGVSTCATCGGQRTLWSQISPALMWLLEIVLRSQAGCQVSLPSEPSHWHLGNFHILVTR